MKVRFAFLVAVALLFCGAGFARDSPKIEATGDYSYYRFNPGLSSTFNSHSLNAGGGDVTLFLKPMIGIKADLQGYGSFTECARPGAELAGCASGNLFTYMFGPELKYRAGKFNRSRKPFLAVRIPTFTPTPATASPAFVAASLPATMPLPLPLPLPLRWVVASTLP